ncbi:MAG: chemotaxis response regulator protein-glutamate methylesterase [Hyphomicrobiales bacterium]
MVKVMVVDDSVVIRGLVSRWIAEDDELECVAKCANGQIGVDKAKQLNPDVIVLDIEMPVMDGITALPLLLKACPRTRIIIASTLSKRNAAITIKALSLGAAECLPKPDSNSGVTTSADFRRELIAKVRALGGLDKVTGPGAATGGNAAAGMSAQERRAGAKLRREKMGISVGQPAPAPAAAGSGAITLLPFNKTRPRALAIGSSTGGPQALMQVLTDLGQGLAGVPCFITQHMPPTFTAMLAENLQRKSDLQCKEAEEGDIPEPGKVYIAPGGKHMILKKNSTGVVIHIDDGPPVNFCKPCVDLMFDSLAQCYGTALLAVVLTGMGADGARGAGTIRQGGGNVIAQDEKTSVVWGMPGTTSHAGICSAVLPIEKIGGRTANILKGDFR